MNPSNVVDFAAARAAWRITRFVVDYEHRHPLVPSPALEVERDAASADTRSRDAERYRSHPAVRACIGRAHSALVDFLGGPGPAWDQLIHAAQYWFAPGDDSTAYLCLRGQFQVAQGMCGSEPRMQAAVARFRAWRGLPVRTRVIHFPGGDAVRVAVPPD